MITEIPKPKSTRNAHQDQDGAISLDSAPEMKNGEDLTWLRNMVMGKLKYKDSQMTLVAIYTVLEWEAYRSLVVRGNFLH